MVGDLSTSKVKSIRQLAPGAFMTTGVVGVIVEKPFIGGAIRNTVPAQAVAGAPIPVGLSEKTPGSGGVQDGSVDPQEGARLMLVTVTGAAASAPVETFAMAKLPGTAASPTAVGLGSCRLTLKLTAAEAGAAKASEARPAPSTSNSRRTGVMVQSIRVSPLHGGPYRRAMTRP